MHVVVHKSGQREREKGKSEVISKASSLHSTTCLAQNVRRLYSTFIPENGAAWWYAATKCMVSAELMLF